MICDYCKNPSKVKIEYVHDNTNYVENVCLNCLTTRLTDIVECSVTIKHSKTFVSDNKIQEIFRGES